MKTNDGNGGDRQRPSVSCPGDLSRKQKTKARHATKTTAIGPRQHPLIVMLVFGILLSAANAGTPPEPPIRAPAPHDFLKNRYISIDPRGAGQTNPSSHHIRVAIDSTLVNGLVGFGPWWATAPVNGKPPSPATCISILSPAKPATAPDWTGCPTLHLTGCPIVPTTTYSIQAEVSGILSPEVLLDTQAKPGLKWRGDCVGFFGGVSWSGPNGVVGAEDFLAAIKTFQNPNAVIATHLSVTDMTPNLNGTEIDLLVNINDVLFAIMGSQGAAYNEGEGGPDLTQCGGGGGECTDQSQCTDSFFCNGVEDCVGGFCVSGTEPCQGGLCDEDLNECAECTQEEECSDLLFCNGLETCDMENCVSGTNPCPGQGCDEANDQCAPLPAFVWVPVGASRSHTIVENKIVLDSGGQTVTLDLKFSGWAFAVGTPELAAFQATVDSSGYTSGPGAPLNPLGWPGSPHDGAFLVTQRCTINQTPDPSGSACVSDGDCPVGEECERNPNWVFRFGISVLALSSLNYAWAAVHQGELAADGGIMYDGGTLILEVPSDAIGTYRIGFDPDSDDTFLTSGTGAPIPDVVLSSAFITILGANEPGRCCSDIGPNVVCEDLVIAQDCAMRPEPRLFAVGETCDGNFACPTCLIDTDCSAGGVCTMGACDEGGQCINIPNFSVEDECCNLTSGQIIWVDDDDACTTDTCDLSTGQVNHTDIPDCISFDADEFPKNRYVSFQTGVLAVERAYRVRMTASAHFPESIGDLGWVGAPDSKSTALVVPDPVFLPSWPAIVRAGDCEIVPAATYEIRATVDGVNFENPIVIETTAPPGIKFWGDIVGDFNGVAWTPPNGVQNFADVQAGIKTFQGAESTAPLIWADIEPETPNRVVNFNDVLFLILAFTGDPYPFSAPADCP